MFQKPNMKMGNDRQAIVVEMRCWERGRYLFSVGGPWPHHITALLTVTKDNARFTDVLSISAKSKGRRCEIKISLK